MSIESKLSLDPVPAHWIAHHAGIPVTDVYAELVRLYDAGRARIVMQQGDGQRNKVAGWVKA